VRALFAPAAGIALAVALVFLTLPLIAIFVDVPPGDLVASLGDAAAVDALRLSLETSVIALALIIAIGTPAAWMLATRRWRGRSVIITLVELPLVVPPAVAGIGLLAALGPRGLLGGALADGGIRLVLETSGVVVALTFVASPFYVRQAIAVPVARGALVAGAALAWGRALGEFGATLMFAGSFRGVTQTAPLAIYERFATDFTGALALAGVLVALSGAILLTVKVFLAAR
jgi:molybdate transport system permease protein